MSDTKTLISDEQISVAFENTNFGDKPKREIIADGLRKVCEGYANGYTCSSILLELGLTTTRRDNPFLSQTGMQYLEAFHKEQLKQLKSGIVGFVKVSERMPTEKGVYCVKRLGENTTALAHKNTKGEMCFWNVFGGQFKGWKSFEWLDETPIVSETDLSGKLKEAVEVIEQLKSRVPDNDTWDKKAHFVANHFLTSLTQNK